MYVWGWIVYLQITASIAYIVYLLNFIIPSKNVIEQQNNQFAFLRVFRNEDSWSLPINLSHERCALDMSGWWHSKVHMLRNKTVSGF